MLEMYMPTDLCILTSRTGGCGGVTADGSSLSSFCIEYADEECAAFLAYQEEEEEDEDEDEEEDDEEEKDN